MVNKIKRIYKRTYTDNGQQTIYVEWENGSRTECPADAITPGGHMQALIERATHEGLRLEQEVW